MHSSSRTAEANQADGATSMAEGATGLCGVGSAPNASTAGQTQAAPVRSARVISIAIDGTSTEEWLAGKLLEHSVGLAGEALRQYQGRELDATITLGDRTATIKVTR